MPKRPFNTTQLGTTGLKRYGPYIYEEFLPELRWPRAGKVYKEMADNDAVIGAILYLAEMLVRGVQWSVKPASRSNEDLMAAEFLKNCMHDMEMSWANTISEVLSMFTYGFSFHEIVYKIRRGPNESNGKYKSKYNDGRIAWRKMPIRAQTSLYQWTFDEDGDAIEFIQMAEPEFKVTHIPLARGLLFTTKLNKGNPEGRSLLRNAYRSWFFKKHFEEIEGIGIERDLAGFPVLTAPDNLDLWNNNDPEMVVLRKKAEDLVSSVRRDSEEGLLLPHGWNLELLTSGSSRQIDIGATISRYDNRIAITMLSDIVLIGGNQSGSFALTDAKQSMLSAALQSQLSNIADVFNSKAVPDLFRFNNFTDIKEYPTIMPGIIHNPTFKELALILRAMGLDIAGDLELQNFFRHLLGMPDLDKQTFEQVYQIQLSAKQDPDNARVNTRIKGSATASPKNKEDDTAENDFEQNDQVYTGGGE